MRDTLADSKSQLRSEVRWCMYSLAMGQELLIEAKCDILGSWTILAELLYEEVTRGWAHELLCESSQQTAQKKNLREE